MTVARKLALIALGYGLAVFGGIVAVALNELRMSVEIEQGSGGMVAFGDAILFILATGVLSLAPTWFLLKLLLARAPRAVLAGELTIAVIGPLSWLAVIQFTDNGGHPSPPSPGMWTLGLFVAFCAFPRIALGPVLVVIEAATAFLLRDRLVRALLAVAMLMDLVPLALFVTHMMGPVRH
jgi:hypothetical protein